MNKPLNNNLKLALKSVADQTGISAGDPLPADACPRCGDFGRRYAEPGEMISIKSFDQSVTSFVVGAGDAFRYMIPCDDCKPKRDAAQKKRYQALSEMTDLDQGYLLESFILKDKDGDRKGTAAMIEAGREMLDGDCNMITVWGKYGNGKSMFLKAMVNHFLDLGYPALYISAFDAIQWIQDAYHRDGTIKTVGEAGGSALDRIDMLKDVAVLALDELQAFKPTDWNISIIESIVDRRWNKAIAKESYTLFAMNESPANLSDRIQTRIKDRRLRASGPTIILNEDSDVRPKLKRK